MAADQVQRAKLTRSNAENFSPPDGQVSAGSVVCGPNRCLFSGDGRRPLERASSMPGRITSPGYGSTHALARCGVRPRRTPSSSTTASQPEALPLRREPPEAGEKPGRGGAVGPEVIVSTPTTTRSTRTATPSSTSRRHVGSTSTSFTFRRKRVLDVPADKGKVPPQIDRAVSPLPCAAASPSVTRRDTATTTKVVTTRHPIYTRRFASLRLPSGARTIGSSRHPPSPSVLLSPASAANGASDNRSIGGSYTRMQLLQNIGKVR